MKAIAFGIAFAGTMIGYGIASTRKGLDEGQNISACLTLLICLIGMILS